MRTPDFWHKNDAGSRALSLALAPLGSLYAATVAWKSRRSIPYRAGARVICVGNLTVGGSGKTPLAIALAKMLQKRGARIAFLTRGYGRHRHKPILVNANLHDANAVGDEALLLARVAPTVVSGDRAVGARLAEQEGADVIVMDDGHQNFTLAKNLSLVVVDGETGFGNGRVVPAGPLREGVRQGLTRADAVVVMGEGDPPLDGFPGAVLRAHLVCERCFDGQAFVAFAGIGRPEKFFAAIRAQGAILLEAHPFADHHAYTAVEISRLRQRAAAAGARLITTEKDLVRLGESDGSGIEVLPVHAAFDDSRAAEALLSGAVASP